MILRQMIHARKAWGAYAPGNGPNLTGAALDAAIRTHIHKSIERRAGHPDRLAAARDCALIRSVRKHQPIGDYFIRERQNMVNSTARSWISRVIRHRYPNIWNDLDMFQRVDYRERSFLWRKFEHGQLVLKRDLRFRSGVILSQRSLVQFNRHTGFSHHVTGLKVGPNDVMRLQ